MSEAIFYQVRERSYRLANMMLNDCNDAEDIAQIVSIKFLLKQEEVDHPLAWSQTVTKREVYSRYKELDKSEILYDKDTIQENENITPQTESEIAAISLEEAGKYLSKEDFKIFKLWVKSELDINRLAKKLKVSYNSAQAKVYQMKKNLKASICLSNGYVGSKDILDYNLSRKIAYLIKMIVAKSKENDLRSLGKYLQDCDEATIPELDIKQVFGHGVKLINMKQYKLTIPYKDSEDNVKSFGIEIKLDNRNRLFITRFYVSSRKIVKIKASMSFVLSKLPKKEKGVIPNTYEEAVKILKKYT